MSSITLKATLETMNSQNNSTYGTAYVPDKFLSSLKELKYAGKNPFPSAVTTAWIVRTYHLFEAVSDHLRRFYRIKSTAESVILDWVNQGGHKAGAFSSETGRLVSADHLSFVAKTYPSLKTSDIKRIYSAVSKVMKQWDEWYLAAPDRVALTVVDLVGSAIAPVSPSGLPGVESTLSASSKFKVNESLDSQFPDVTVMDGVPCRKVSYGAYRDKSFDNVRIDPPAVKSEEKFKEITGGLSIDNGLAYVNEIDAGRDAVILPVMADPSTLSAVERAAEQDKMRNIKEAGSILRFFPVLDWLTGNKDEK